MLLGFDVGKGQRHAVALDRNGKRLYNKMLPDDEAQAARSHRRTQDSWPTPVRRRPAFLIGALPVAVACAEGMLVAYLPGLTMRRIADLHAGEAKSDARDTAIIAEAVCSMPHTLRSLRLADEQLAELTMLCGFDDDLTAQVTQTSNSIRGLLTQIHPALKRVLGPRLDHPAVLDLLERYPSPAAFAATSEKTLANRVTKLAPRMGKSLAAEIVQALNEQAVIVPGTQAATIVMPRLAQQLAALCKQRDEVRSARNATWMNHHTALACRCLYRALSLAISVLFRIQCGFIDAARVGELDAESNTRSQASSPNCQPMQHPRPICKDAQLSTVRPRLAAMMVAQAPGQSGKSGDPEQLHWRTRLRRNSSQQTSANRFARSPLSRARKADHLHAPGLSALSR
ncbi:IS110 family transposase [Burkholderia sp. BKH01]|nr:IS110 family transposase [Burkholderia sp. BKH01]MCU9951928.1 IS110 family transposase [Burkholderia sp. BKH01]